MINTLDFLNTRENLGAEDSIFKNVISQIANKAGGNYQTALNDLQSYFSQEKKTYQTLEEQFREFKLEQYKSKLSKYQSKLTSFEPTFAKPYNPNLTIFEIHQEKIQEDNRKRIILRVVDLLSDLLISFDQAKDKELNKLESELKGLDVYPIVFCIDNFEGWMHKIVLLKESTKQRVSYLRNTICLTRKRKLKFIGRDIRQSYRNIIRIIFKNMDDNSGDDDNLFFYNIQKQHFISSLIFVKHEQKIDYRSIGHNFKYK